MGRPSSRSILRTASTVCPSAIPGAVLNEMVIDGNCPVVHRKRRKRGPIARHCRQRNQTTYRRCNRSFLPSDLQPVGTRNGHTSDAVHRGPAAKRRRNFQHHTILIELRIHRGNLPLAKRIVERIIDRSRTLPKPRRGVAIDDHQAADRMSADHLPHHAARVIFSDARARAVPRNLALQVGILQRVLILRACESTADADILLGLQKQPHSFDS